MNQITRFSVDAEVIKSTILYLSFFTQLKGATIFTAMFIKHSITTGIVTAIRSANISIFRMMFYLPFSPGVSLITNVGLYARHHHLKSKLNTMSKFLSNCFNFGGKNVLIKNCIIPKPSIISF